MFTLEFISALFCTYAFFWELCISRTEYIHIVLLLQVTLRMPDCAFLAVLLVAVVIKTKLLLLVYVITRLQLYYTSPLFLFVC